MSYMAALRTSSFGQSQWCCTNVTVLGYMKLPNNYWSYLVSVHVGYSRDCPWYVIEYSYQRSRPKIVALSSVTLDTFAIGPKAMRMKIDETTIGVNGVPQLPLVVTIQQPSASSLHRFRHLFRDRSDLFRSQGSARVAQFMRTYEFVLTKKNNVLVIKPVLLYHFYVYLSAWERQFIYFVRQF